MTVKGIARYTFKQDRWNEHTDYKEYDIDNNLVGIWCDWFNDSITPEPLSPIPKNINSKITYSGTKPEIKINGNSKKFTVTFYNDDEPIEYQYGDWKFTIDDLDVSDLLKFDSSNLDENQVKIRFCADDTYIGKILNVSFESYMGIKSNIEIKIIGS